MGAKVTALKTGKRGSLEAPAPDARIAHRAAFQLADDALLPAGCLGGCSALAGQAEPVQAGAPTMAHLANVGLTLCQR
jgi:hypothetical protein